MTEYIEQPPEDFFKLLSRVRKILEDVTFEQIYTIDDNWTIDAYEQGMDGNSVYLQVSFLAINRDNGEAETQRGRKWLLSEHMTDSEIVCTAFKAVLAAVEHEARENFLYKGRAIFGPHISIEALHACAETLDARTR